MDVVYRPLPHGLRSGTPQPWLPGTGVNSTVATLSAWGHLSLGPESLEGYQTQPGPLLQVPSLLPPDVRRHLWPRWGLCDVKQTCSMHLTQYVGVLRVTSPLPHSTTTTHVAMWITVEGWEEGC